MQRWMSRRKEAGNQRKQQNAVTVQSQPLTSPARDTRSQGIQRCYKVELVRACLFDWVQIPALLPVTLFLPQVPVHAAGLDWWWKKVLGSIVTFILFLSSPRTKPLG